MKISLLMALLIQPYSYSVAGVGSGGGGDPKEEALVTRFAQVLNRVSSEHKQDTNVREIVSAIKTALANSPLEILYPEQLTYCDTGAPIKEIKAAWGCPGKLQLLENFELDSDAMIFHELTRITPGYENVDENHRLSIGKLKLHVRQKTSVRIEVHFSKDQYTRRSLNKWINRNYSAGAEAVGIKETKSSYKLITFFPIYYPSSIKVERHIFSN